MNRLREFDQPQFILSFLSQSAIGSPDARMGDLQAKIYYLVLRIAEEVKGNGLIPVITQDSASLRGLTLTYVNQEALKKTLETGFAHYYWRSWGKVMKKGMTSGNTQKIVDIYIDCDSDSLIFLIEPNDAACHLGKESCFHNRLEGMNRL